jgi:tetratricopeptide (TPR) repeat protein
MGMHFTGWLKGSVPRLRLISIAIGLGILSLSAMAAADPATDAPSLRIIVVSSAAEAEAVLEQLKAGADFARLARQKSADATSIDGGFLGAVDPSSLRPELRAAIRDIKPGQFSKPVRIPTGFAILEVLLPRETTGRENAQPARQFALSGLGSVRYAFDIGGLGEADAAFNAFPKPVDWTQDLRGACELRKQSFVAVNARLQKALNQVQAAGEPLNQNRQSFDIAQMYVAQGQLYAYKGEMDAAIDQWKKAHSIAEAGFPKAIPYLDEMLGVAYLHKAEMDNGVYRNPGSRCLFPMGPEARYARTSSSGKAVQYFLKCLAHGPDNLEVKWLLNLAYMTLGGYPAEVPKEYLLPPSLFASNEDIGRFTDVAAEAGLNLFSMAGGIIVDDFDNDGLLDVVASSWDMCAPLHFFHNNGDGTFTDRAEKAGLSAQLGGLNMIQTDYNNDGCLDILVLRGAWELPQRKSLLRNNCDGTFTDVTRESGLAVPATSTNSAVWVDINNDGLLDLFVANENEPAQLFLNNGNGTFKDISHASGIDKVAYSKGVAAADYDNDGYMDLYVSNLVGDNFLYHNNRDGTFTEVAKEAGAPGSARGFATWFFDYDNDGWPDVLVASYFMSVEETARNYLGPPHNGPTLKLYRNLGNGKFRDVTADTGLDKVLMVMGANFGDVDSDGYLDLYLGTGNPSYASLLPNVLLRNKEGKSFVDITTSSGTGDLHKGHGIAFADLDNDGDEDILAVSGGAVPGDSHAIRLFENPGQGNDWINLRLVGVKANRAAIGARIKVTVKNADQATRSIFRTVGSGGSFGASPLQQHIGLGKSARIVSVEIWWPGGSRTPQKFSGVSKNNFLEITEFAQDCKILVKHPFRLGGAKRVAADERQQAVPTGN